MDEIAKTIQEGFQLLATMLKDIIKGKVDEEIGNEVVKVKKKDLEYISRFSCQERAAQGGKTCSEFVSGRGDCNSCWARKWAEGNLGLVKAEKLEKNPNENVLTGFRCPECGSYGPFKIAADAWFEVHDSGTEYHTDVEWNDDSVCICLDCSFNGTIAAFRKVQKEYEPIGGGGGQGRSDLLYGQGGGD